MFVKFKKHKNSKYYWKRAIQPAELKEQNKKQKPRQNKTKVSKKVRKNMSRKVDIQRKK